MRQGGRWMLLAALGSALTLHAGFAAAAEPDEIQAATSQDAIETSDVTLEQGEARALAARLEQLFGVGAAAAPWRDGLRTMADIPAMSFDALDENTLRVRAPAGDLATVVAVARAVDLSRAEPGGLVRVFGFERATQAQGAGEAMQRLRDSKLLPGAGAVLFDAPGRLLVAMAPPAAHPMMERIARDYGGTVISLAERSDAQIRLALERARAARTVAEAELAEIEVVAIEEPAHAESIEMARTPEREEIEPEPVAPPALASTAEVIEAAPADESAHIVEAPAPAEPVEVAEAGPTPAPTIVLPGDAPEQEVAVVVVPKPVATPQRVVRVVVLQAADALVVGPRVQRVMDAAFEDVQVTSAGAGNALLVTGWDAEAAACVAVLEEIDAAAARMTEDAMLVMLDGPGAADIASAVQQLVRRPGGETGVRIASDEARGAIALTGPHDASTLVGGLAEALGRIDYVPDAPLPASPALAQAPAIAPRPAEHPIATNTEPPRERAGRDVVVKAIRPEGEVRQTAEFVRQLLERAGISPVRVTDLAPGRSQHGNQDDIELARRRKLLVPKRIRMIIKWSQSTLAQLVGAPFPDLDPQPFEQVFATPEPRETDPRLEVIVLPDRQALAFVGEEEIVAKGAELADALSVALGLDRIEVVQMRYAHSTGVARALERALTQEPGAGGQLRVSDEPRVNMVVISGPAGAARRAAALARELDLQAVGQATPPPSPPPRRGGGVRAPSADHGVPNRGQSVPKTDRGAPNRNPSAPKTDRGAPASGPSAPDSASVSISAPPRVSPPRAVGERVVVETPNDAARLNATSRGYIIDPDTPLAHNLAPVAIATEDFAALLDELVAHGEARRLARHDLATTATGLINDGPGPFASGVWITSEPGDAEQLRVQLQSVPRSGDRTTVDLEPGEVLLLTGSVRETSGGVLIDLARHPLPGGETGVIVLRLHEAMRPRR